MYQPSAGFEVVYQCSLYGAQINSDRPLFTDLEFDPDALSAHRYALELLEYRLDAEYQNLDIGTYFYSSHTRELMLYSNREFGLMFFVALLSMIICAPAQTGTASTYLIPLLFIVAVIPYMAANLGFLGKHNRVFLGDAGSMMLGLVVAWLLIRYTQGTGKIFSPVTGLWLIAIPLMDMLAIVTRRSRNGKAPFEPDRNHLHHLFMDRGMNERQALLLIGLVAIVFAGIGVLGEIYASSQLVMLLAFLIISFAYYQLVAYFENQKPIQV